MDKKGNIIALKCLARGYKGHYIVMTVIAFAYFICCLEVTFLVEAQSFETSQTSNNKPPTKLI